MVLLVCVCALHVDIIASRVVDPADIPSERCMYGDTNCVFPIGIHGEGDERIYPLGRIPTGW